MPGVKLGKTVNVRLLNWLLFGVCYCPLEMDSVSAEENTVPISVSSRTASKVCVSYVAY